MRLSIMRGDAWERSIGKSGKSSFGGNDELIVEE